MSDFKITGVGDEERFSTANGEFVSYEVQFEGQQGNGTAHHKRKASSPVPTVGEVIDADLVQKNGKTELKRVWKDKPRGGGGHSEDPKRSAEIRRMASQKCAVALLAVEVAAGLRFENSKASELLKPRIDFFENDAKEAGEKA
jgi:hypothetical protein